MTVFAVLIIKEFATGLYSEAVDNIYCSVENANERAEELEETLPENSTVDVVSFVLADFPSEEEFNEL